MKLLSAVLLVLCLGTTQTLLAHGGHRKALDEAGIFQVAVNTIAQLSERDFGLGIGQLSQSWLSVSTESLRSHSEGPGYYIIAADNTEEEETLYFLISATGEVYDVNFSGEFEGLQ